MYYKLKRCTDPFETDSLVQLPREQFSLVISTERTLSPLSLERDARRRKSFGNRDGTPISPRDRAMDLNVRLAYPRPANLPESASASRKLETEREYARVQAG